MTDNRFSLCSTEQATEGSSSDITVIAAVVGAIGAVLLLLIVGTAVVILIMYHQRMKEQHELQGSGMSESHEMQ